MTKANVHLASRVAKQSLRVVVIFACAIIATLAAERFWFQQSASAISKNIQAISQSRGAILLADEKLTMSALAYALSSNQTWRTRYMRAMPDLETAVTQAKTLATPEDAAVFEKSVQDAHAAMAELEQLVLDLTENGERQDAINIFSSPRYISNKLTIERAINDLLEKVEARATKQLHWTRTRTLVMLLATLIISAAGFLWLSRRLNVALGQAETDFEKSQDAYHMQLAENNDAKLKKSRLEQLGTLIATLAHELRNPLGAVRTSVFILNRTMQAQDEKVERAFSRINTGIERCDNIITQLLAFTQIKPSEKQVVEFDTWLETALPEMAKPLNANLEFTCILGSPGAFVALDTSQMHDVLSRLLTNAAEAMQQSLNGHKTHIHISTEMIDGALQCIISDSGHGIPADILPRVTDPFFTTKSFGAGLGLPTAIRILEQHGGNLNISSQTDTGATVKITLPAA
jgi:signal transduction histidine kinase